VIGRLRTHGGGELLGIVADDRQVERPHHDPLVGDAEAHARRKLVLGEHGLERLRKRDRIGDLAVTHHAGTQLDERASRQRQAAVGAHLGSGEVAGVELEADHAGVVGTLLAEHGHSIGRGGKGLERG
jgi:hypothetical protein